MQFIQTPDTSEGEQALYTALTDALANGTKTLWIVSGGSNIQSSVTIAAQLRATCTENINNLTILLVDERYGEVGHKDSNYQQFQDAGFDDFDGNVSFTPVLQAGLSLEDTAAAYGHIMHNALDDAELVISQLGIGPDGHIAGILPDSLATTTDEEWYAIAYRSDPYERITMTFKALQRITVDYSFAFGANKQQALTQLANSELPLAQQPAQILKQLPTAYVYTDQLTQHNQE